MSENQFATSNFNIDQLAGDFGGYNDSGTIHANENEKVKVPSKAKVKGLVPHKGSLCRIRLRKEDEKTSKIQTSFVYAITIRNTSASASASASASGSGNHGETVQLEFSPNQYTFLENIFAILDTESVGIVHKDGVRDFVMLRCPVFKRRDSDLKQYYENKKENDNGIDNEDDGDNEVENENENCEDESNIWTNTEHAETNIHLNTNMEVTSIDASTDADDAYGDIDDLTAFASISPSENDDGEAQTEFDPQPDHGSYASTHKPRPRGTATAATAATPTLPPNNHMHKSPTTTSMSTFDQVWDVVISSALNYNHNQQQKQQTYPSQAKEYTHLGIEGWMLFCRFIALAQYHDAKRRFSARHLQTVPVPKKHENEFGQERDHDQEPSELIIVDLPPLSEPLVELNVRTLMKYDISTRMANRSAEAYGDAISGAGTAFSDNSIDQGEGIPLPELDLDHSYISIYDDSKKMSYTTGNCNADSNAANPAGANRVSRSLTTPLVQVSVFGSDHLHSDANFVGSPTGQSIGSNSGHSESLEFVIKYLPNGVESNDIDIVHVRRSFDDLEWLDQTFKSHKILGGTLCGRILPPFPSRLRPSSSDYGVGEHLYQKRNVANSAAVAVASAGVSAGVGMVNTAAKTAKSLWSNIPGSKQISKMVKTKVSSPTVVKHVQTFPKTSYSLKNTKKSYETPKSKARQIEKYLNYMLEHPALSTSFPLNLILQASQSGLEAAKRILKDQLQKDNNVRIHRESTGSSDDEKIVSSLRASFFQYLPSPNQTKNLEWVRSAAQAALVLKLHGLLETAGYQSTSTKLQHASLPQYAPNNSHERNESGTPGENAEDSSNVEGSLARDVMSFDDECDGFDILPDTLPFPERSALCAGSVYPSNPSDAASYSAYSFQDRYGMMQTTLGDIEVERDIDRLRELLRRVDKSFATCCNALTGINEHRKMRDSIHVNIIRNIDNWNGMRGKILSQRSMLNGVTALEGTSLHANRSYANFAGDMMWTASLARAAYNASKDVCHAVEAAKTASRAKHTADIAAQRATEAEKESDGSLEEAKILRERVSKSQMQALYAAVVDHEATSAKRRSVISLANDVKYWNIHRKRDMIKACKQVVEEQKLAAAKNMEAWTRLKEGLLESPTIFDVGQKNQHEMKPIHEMAPPDSNSEGYAIEEPESNMSPPVQQRLDANIDVAATLQDYFAPPESRGDDEYAEFDDDKVPSLDDDSNGDLLQPFGDNDPPLTCTDEHQSFSSEGEEAVFFSDALSSSAASHDDDPKHASASVQHDKDDSARSDHGSDFGKTNEGENDDNNGMTDSMQSLVDGLLTWGGGGNWDVEDELGLALPRGMAASIAMEESGIMDIA